MKFKNAFSTTWWIGMAAFTVWFIGVVYVPLLAQVSSDFFSWVTFFTYLAVTLFAIILWGIAGYALSLLLSVGGLLFGLIAEGIDALRNHNKRA